MKRFSAIIIFAITAIMSVIAMFSGKYLLSLFLTFSGLLLCGIFYYFSSVKDAVKRPLSTTGGDSEGTAPEYDEFVADEQVTFDSIAGMEEIKEEIMEIADFLRNPEKYERFGASLPSGILFYGPPGTGKTLIARALANETETAFIYAGGPEFIEKYVGVGAGRIRSLFEKARSYKKCIIFIDEIDAIGAGRSSDSNSERDQTLNQLLTELDGFKSRRGIVVIAATNRIDLLDKALIRPGRFDRHIYVGSPTESAREKILSMHMKGKPVSEDVDIKSIALRTESMSGAELKNVVNEAAILAVRNCRECICREDFDEAVMKITAGLRNGSGRLSGRNLRTVAVHEAGHALVHTVLTGKVPLSVSVEPRNMSLGMVVTSSDEDSVLPGKDELEIRISILLAGRAAEELILGRITTGAADDLKKANEIAYMMHNEMGMSDKNPNMVLLEGRGEEFRNAADRFTEDLLEKCGDVSRDIIRRNEEVLRETAFILEKDRTIDGSVLERILEKHKKSCANG